MSKVIVKTNNKDRWGQRAIWVGVGDITVDKTTGCFETTEEQAKELLETFPEFFIAYKDGKKTKEVEPIQAKSETNELGIGEKVEEKEKKVETETLSAEEQEEIKTAYKESLTGKTRKDLEELCKTSGFPGGEWRGKKQEELVEYLLTKL